MARPSGAVASPLVYLALGALLGAGAGAGAGLLARTVAPAIHDGRALLLYAHDERGGDAVDAPTFVNATLARKGFLSDVVERHRLDPRSAAWLAGRLVVAQAPESDQLASLSLHGSDAGAVERALNALADELVAVHRRAHRDRFDARLARLDAELAAVSARHDELAAQVEGSAPLPMWARSAIVVDANLARQRFELELPARYGLAGDDTVTRSGRNARLAQIARERQALRQKTGGDGNIERARFEREQDLAITRVRLLTLLETKQALLTAAADAPGPLRIVQHAQVARRALTTQGLAILALAGALLGTFAALTLWWLRRPTEVRLSGPVVETDLRTRVVGIMGSALTHYGERKLRPLAQTHPEHLAVAGVYSLRIALHVLRMDPDRAGPVVVAETGPRRHAAHVLANLAMLAADRGERVLLVDAHDEGSPLSAMFKSGTETTLSTTIEDLDTLDDDPAAPHARRGRIRFVTVNGADAPADGGGLPVPGAFVSYFDRVYILARDVEHACALLDGYGGGVGLLVAGSAQRLANLREAHSAWHDRAPSLHGIVLCGYRIDESAYLS